MNKMIVAVAGAALVASGASAQIKTYTGAGGDLPDVTQNRFSIFVPDHGPATVENISLLIEHTWVGDLFIEVRQKTPNGSSLVLMDRPGVPQSTFGNSDGLNGRYDFNDGGLPFPEDAADGEVPPGSYQATASTHRLDTSDKFGEWSLFISDNAGGDEGVLFEWSITMNNIPAPSSLALLGLGGLVAGRRRR